MELKGTITALITPFQGDMIDEEGVVRNVERQIAAGISGLLPLGTTGEAPTLTQNEMVKIISLVVEAAKGKVPIVVGTGYNCTRHTIEETKRAESLGADAAIVVTPYYNKPTQEGIFRHFEAVSQQVNIPIIVYNIQGRAGVNIETATMARIAQLPNLIGVKEASGNLDQISDVVHHISLKNPRFSVVSGDDSMTLPLMAVGGKGVISVVSNLVPEKMSAMVNAALEGRYQDACRLHHELLPLFRASFMEVNPIPIKAAMNLAALPSGGYRLPLCEMAPHNHEKLRKVLLEMEICG